MPNRSKSIRRRSIGAKSRKRAKIENSALEESIARRNRLRILELEGQIDFDPDWDYKQMRRGH